MQIDVEDWALQFYKCANGYIPENLKVVLTEVNLSNNQPPVGSFKERFAWKGQDDNQRDRSRPEFNPPEDSETTAALEP